MTKSRVAGVLVGRGGAWQVQERTEMHTGFCWGNLKERDNLEDPGLNESMICTPILNKWAGRTGTGLIRLSTGTSGGLFLIG